MTRSPEFSIIIPTFNSALRLPVALESVAAQTHRDFELVVSDGASTDGTLELIDRYRSQLPAVTVLSRPDRGVYDAINQGVDAARGRWVYVLGSDDRLYMPKVLADMSRLLGDGNEPFVYGDVVIRGDASFAGNGARYDGEFTMERLLQSNICQQAVFYDRGLIAALGGFALKYRVVADWHFALRVFNRYPVRWVDVVVCEFCAGGLSTQQDDRRFREDWPDLLAQLCLDAPFRPEFVSARWMLREAAGRYWRSGQRGRALRSAMASRWLRALHRSGIAVD